MQFTEGDTGRLTVIDETRNTVQLTFDADSEVGLQPGGDGLDVFREVGYDPGPQRHTETERFTAPPVAVTVIDLSVDEPDHRNLTDGDTAAIDPETAVVLRTPVLVHVRPQVTGQIRRTTEAVVVEFDDRAPVEIGFECRDGEPPGTIAVEESLAGVARGLSALGCNTPTTSPDRSFPNARKQPPRMEFRDREAVQSALDDCPDTDTEIVVPDADTDGLAHLLPTAGLLHYVGAEATIDPDASGTHLRAGAETYHLGDDPETVDQTATDLLRTVFFLDCLARTGGPYGTDLVERELLEELALDAQTLYEMPLAQRVQTYLNTTQVYNGGRSGVDVLERLPEWHLGLHVEPTLSRVPALSHYLGRLADVYTPEAATLETLADRGNWAERTTRSNRAHTAGDLMVAPAQRARTVGWYGPRRALGGFNVVGDGTPRPRPLAEGNLSVTVVQAAEEFVDDEAVADYYREPGLPMDVTVLQSPTADELQTAFERPTDLLHFVGHCENAGLRCADGTLSAGVIDECQVEAFFLNACGSLGFAEKLVERGAAAGAATTRAVFGETAGRVGCNWARLLAHGWTIERALDVARSVDDPAGYVAVGDGTHFLSDGKDKTPPEYTLHDIKSADPTVELSCNTSIEVGSRGCPELTGQEQLLSTQKECRLYEQRVQRVLPLLDHPVKTNDELIWNPESLVKD